MTSKEFRLLSVVQAITLVLVIVLVLDRFATPGPRSSSSSRGSAMSVSNAVKSPKTDPGENYIYGDVKAPNSLIVYSNYNCDYCRHFYVNVLDSLLEGQVKTGKLKIVCKDFITVKDNLGMLMAKVAEVGRQTGHFPQVHKLLAAKGTPSDSAAVIKLGIDGGISSNEMEARLNSDATLIKIARDYSNGKTLNIESTPSFVLNGKLYTGYLSYSDIVAYANLN